MDETTPEKDELKNRKGCGKKLKKKFQVVESDDANSHESEDEDGYLLSVFRNKRAGKQTLTDDGEKIPQATVEMADKMKNDVCDRNPKEKHDPIDSKPQR